MKSGRVGDGEFMDRSASEEEEESESKAESSELLREESSDVWLLERLEREEFEWFRFDMSADVDDQEAIQSQSGVHIQFHVTLGNASEVYGSTSNAKYKRSKTSFLLLKPICVICCS